MLGENHTRNLINIKITLKRKKRVTFVISLLLFHLLKFSSVFKWNILYNYINPNSHRNSLIREINESDEKSFEHTSNLSRWDNLLMYKYPRSIRRKFNCSISLTRISFNTNCWLQNQLDLNQRYFFRPTHTSTITSRGTGSI